MGSPARFAAGKEVEVSHHDEGFGLVWSEARIVRSFADRRRYSVAFAADDDSRPLAKTFAAARIRPRPHPPSDPEGFRLYQQVEALHNGSWRPGVVSRLPLDEEERFAVCFPIQREELQFGVSQLRPQIEWVDGEWVSLDDKDKSIKSQNNGPIKSADRKKFLYASKTHDSKVLIKRFSSGHKFPICATYAESKNQEKNSFPNQLESSLGCKKSKKGETIEDNTLLSDFLLVTRGNRTPNAVKIGFDVTTPIIEEPNFHIKAIPERCVSTNPFKEGNVLNQENVTDTSLNNFLGEINEEPLAPAISSQESPMLHTPLSTIGPSNNGGECSSMQRGERSRHSDMSEHPCSSLGHETNDFHGRKQSKNGCCLIVNDQQRNGISSRRQLQKDVVSFDCSLNLPATGVKRRKRDRPRKLKVKSILQGGPMKGQNDNKPVGGTLVADLCASHVEAINPPETLANCSEAEVINGIVGSPDASFVESSLSGVQLSEIGNEAQNEVLHQALEEQVEKRALIENERSAVDLNHNKSHSGESVCLPFEKCSSMWENIEWRLDPGVLMSRKNAHKAGKKVPMTNDIELTSKLSASDLGEVLLNFAVKTVACSVGLLGKLQAVDQTASEANSLKGKLEAAEKARDEATWLVEEEKAKGRDKEEELRVELEAAREAKSAAEAAKQAALNSSQVDRDTVEKMAAKVAELEPKLATQEAELVVKSSELAQKELKILSMENELKEKDGLLLEAAENVGNLQEIIRRLRSPDHLRELLRAYLGSNAFVCQSMAVYRMGFDACLELLRAVPLEGLNLNRILPSGVASEAEYVSLAAVDRAAEAVREKMREEEKFLPVCDEEAAEWDRRVEEAMNQALAEFPLPEAERTSPEVEVMVPPQAEVEVQPQAEVQHAEEKSTSDEAKTSE